MHFTHLANTFFEEEIAGLVNKNLQSTICCAPLALLLQFLPIIYAKKADSLIVTHQPMQDYIAHMSKYFDGPDIMTLETVRSQQNLNLWAPSQLIEKWAFKKGHVYDYPAWNLAKQLQSKLFCYHNTKRPLGSSLLHTMQDIDHWKNSVKGPLLLKKVWGTAGRGHCLIKDDSKWTEFAKKELMASGVLIGEPFLNRRLDFSTQWMIEKEGSILYLGAVLQKNTPLGNYRASIVDDEDKLFGEDKHLFDSHRSYALDLLKKIRGMGFWGHIGLDAMIVDKDGLIPVVEINLRKTMGYVALMAQRNHFPHQRVTMSFNEGDIPLLPNQLQLSLSRTQSFKTQFYLSLS
ncbi:MAG: hypothetical protein JHC93_00615 [Parachlamydiales bacterium]|nr:hypothetical protein [Parachlamydiales bacterium]